MGIVDQIRGQMEAFASVRAQVVEGVPSPPKGEGINFGKPPFLVIEGDDCYAVVMEGGEIHPLPFGYQVDADDLEVDDDTAIFSWPMPTANGTGLAQMFPLRADFEMPSDEAFEIEEVTPSDGWELVDQVIDAFSDAIIEDVNRRFGRHFVTIAHQLKRDNEEVVSLDHALVLLLQRSGLVTDLYLTCIEQWIAEARSEEEEKYAEEED